MKTAIALTIIVLLGTLGSLYLGNNESSKFLVKNENAYYLDPIDDIVDNSTYANMQEVVTEHLHLDLDLDFDKKVAVGNVTLTMKALIDKPKEIILDSRYLEIYGVYFGHYSLDYYFTEENPNIGSALHIRTPTFFRKDETFKIKIYYSTTNKTLSLNWLEPEQTASKTMPYVFTHCEAIDCRTLIPLQDTPSVKATYSALISTPIDMTVHMTGNTTNVDYYEEQGIRVTSVEMNIPIPSYLIALAAGNLTQQKIGRNTAVITEPPMLEKSAKELEQVQDSLDTAQSFLTPYEWGDYNIIIMPPSFPFGGMENPLLTFASPTIIVGDKSQIDVATHEIAHSWTGNLVTNRNWENFWLNEGFTVYTERHVTRKQRGEEFYKVSAALGNSSLFAAMEDLGMNTTFTTLHPIYHGQNPYDTFSEVPYEKGFQFLTHIENLIGIEHMEKFLKGYIQKFTHHSITYVEWWNTFQDFLNNNFNAQKVKEINSQIDLDAWLHKPGSPPVQLDFSTPNLTISRELASEYIKLGGESSPDNYKLFEDYFSLLKCTFLTSLIDQKDSVTIPVLEKIDSDYNLTETIDPEQKVLWYQLGISVGYEKVVQPADQFLGEVGRLKYLKPLYKALNSYDHDLAVKIFNKYEDSYHPVAVIRIKEVLQI